MNIILELIIHVSEKSKIQLRISTTQLSSREGTKFLHLPGITMDDRILKTTLVDLVKKELKIETEKRRANENKRSIIEVKYLENKSKIII